MISLASVFAALLVQSSLVRSQNTTATCEAGFEWVSSILSVDFCMYMLTIQLDVQLQGTKPLPDHCLAMDSMLCNKP